jgi:hypothetical protein
MTICRVLKPNTELPPPPPELAAMFLPPFARSRVKYPQLCVACQTVYKGGSKRPSAAVQPPSTNMKAPVT